MVSLLTKVGVLAVAVAIIVRTKAKSKGLPKVFHSECVGFACKDVEGPGPNKCANNAVCLTQLPFHKECQAGKCVWVFSPGASTCKEDGDCP